MRSPGRYGRIKNADEHRRGRAQRAQSHTQGTRLNHHSPVPSINACGDRIGALIADHLVDTFRVLLSGPFVTKEPGFTRLLTGEPHPFGNLAVVGSRDEMPATAAAIEPLIASGAPAAVAFPGPVSSDVDQYIREAGFTPFEAMPAMAVDIEKLASPPLANGYTFVRVATGPESKTWAQALASGYEIPLAAAEALSPPAEGPDTARDARLQFFAVMKNNTPVSTSVLCLLNGAAGIYGVSTLPAERGKGLGAFVTAQPLRIAHGLGYRVGVLQSSKAGHPVYQRLGFAEFGELPMYIRMPG